MQTVRSAASDLAAVGLKSAAKAQDSNHLEQDSHGTPKKPRNSEMGRNGGAAWSLNLGIRRNLVCQQQPERGLASGFLGSGRWDAGPVAGLGQADLAAWRLGQLVHALLF